MIDLAWEWWDASGKQHIPTESELGQYRNTWLADIFMYDRLIRRQESYIVDDD